MALTPGQKSVRVLKMLRGMRRPRVFGALAAYGFQQSDLEEGWQLLRGSSDTKYDIPTVVPNKSNIYSALDTLENKWFPICKAALDRSHPEVSGRVFLNLTQTSGLEVSLSMNTFARRMRELDKSAAADDRAARALLLRRGLTESVLVEIEGLLKSLEVEPKPIQPPTPSVTDVRQAEDAMWAWYLEWSTVARQAVHDRRLLRSLGFLTSRGTDVPVDEATDEDVADDGSDTDVDAPQVGVPAGA